MDSVSFSKYNGLGNDFVIIDNRKLNYSFSASQIKLISDRKFGIGCDQFILLENSDKGDVRMRTFNADGGEVEICGNATRCVTSIITAEKNKNKILIQTNNKLVECERVGDTLFSVNMGKSITSWDKIPILKDLDTDNIDLNEFGLNDDIFEFVGVISVGNPDCILSLKSKDAKNLLDLEVAKFGRFIENHSLFPERTNVEFIQILSRDKIKIRIWERGAGETLACGSGACAVQALCYRKGLTNNIVEVQSEGGSLFVKIDENCDVIMTGGASKVFDGVIDINLLKNRG